MRHAVPRPGRHDSWHLRRHQMAFLVAVVIAVSVVAGLLGWLTA